MINIDKKIAYPLMIISVASVIFGAGIWLGQSTAVVNVCKPEELNFSLFWDAYNKLHASFINPEKIEDEKVIYGAIAGMAKSVGDPYTDFFNPSEAKAFQQSLAGSFEGIGAEVGLKKEQLTIIAPLKRTPAQKAGLKAGDQITSIDGKSTQDMSVEEAVNLIRGKKGTKVTLTIYREGWSKTEDFSIVRDTIKIDSIEWELKDGDVAYIQIHQFGQSLSSDFKRIAFEILESPAQKIVLDLRNNPGGYLEVCQDIAGWFLKKGDVVVDEAFGLGKF